MDDDNSHMAEATVYMAIAICRGLMTWKVGSSETITGDSFSAIRTCCSGKRGGVKPTKRRRRSAAELQAVRAESAISVTVDGTQFDGQPEHIARFINAMKAA